MPQTHFPERSQALRGRNGVVVELTSLPETGRPGDRRRQHASQVGSAHCPDWQRQHIIEVMLALHDIRYDLPVIDMMTQGDSKSRVRHKCGARLTFWRCRTARNRS